MRRAGVIGAGRIGGPVIEFLRQSPDWSLGPVLVRHARPEPGFVTDPDAFMAQPCDLVLEVAGPAALRLYGARALATSEVWTVSASALADPGVRDDLESAGRRSGRRLRVLGGAVAGLDGVLAAAEAGGDLTLTAERPGLTQASGTVGALAAAHPGETSFAVAAALAGPGLERSGLRLGPGAAHRLVLRFVCDFGEVTTEVRLQPLAPDRMHPVAAAVIAALRQESRVIRVG